MKLSNIFLAVLGGITVMNASASTLILSGVDGVKDSSGYYVGPYSGTLDGTPYPIFCDDFDHHINIGDTETVNVSKIGDLSKTRFGSVTAATTLYEEAFYLSSFLQTASATDRGDIQDAIWSYFASDSPNPTGTGVKYWETKAAANYAGKDYSNFRILTDSTNQFSGKQELFISTTPTTVGLTSTPEPGTWALLLTGLGGFAVSRFRRKA